MKQKLIRRIKASKDGAVIFGFIYLGIIGLLNFVGKAFFELPTFIRYILSPASLLLGLESSEKIILGVPSNILFFNLVIYVCIGYLLDWIIDPYE